jgi:ElaB/YqjD/DUF883 family membrane-anchored ribosome-binding protein
MANNPNNPQRSGGEFGTGASRFGQSQQGHQGTSVADKGREVASSVGEKAKDLASSVSEQARGAVSTVQQKAGEVASQIGHKAEDAATAVADTWQAGRDYVMEQGFSGMADDLATIIRRNPIPSMLIGFGLGFLLARTMKD